MKNTKSLIAFLILGLAALLPTAAHAAGADQIGREVRKAVK